MNQSQWTTIHHSHDAVSSPNSLAMKQLLCCYVPPSNPFYTFIPFQSTNLYYVPMKHCSPTLLNRSSVNLDEDFYRDICRKLEDCATDQSGLDIYQIAGFYKFYQPPSGSYLRYYLPSAFKAMLCCCIQTAGMIAFMYNVLMTMPKSIAECNLDEEWDLKLLATLLSLYIHV